MKYNQPAPDIHFYEDKKLHQTVVSKSVLTRIVQACSFGIIKTDTQATAIVLLLVLLAFLASYLFVQKSTTIPPTTTYELLPQESVGSPQGLPQI